MEETVLTDARLLFDFLSEAEEPAGKADIVLAMGSQDLEVADTAAQAFWDCQAGWLICSGGFGKDTAALFSQPEGVLYARRCIQLGVPEDRVLVEDRAANSGENFQRSRALLKARGITPKTGVIACKPYMARRARAAGGMQWPEVAWQVARPAVSLEQYLARNRSAAAVLELMVGDLQRLRVYGGRFQLPVEVPDTVWSACARLAGAGYDRYVIGEI